MEVQSAIAFDTDELERLKGSNLLKDFVSVQGGSWNHVDWEDFISSVRELGYSLPVDVIGAELEMEKSYYWKVKNGELAAPEGPVSLKEMIAHEATSCEGEAAMCEAADALQKTNPYDVHGPDGPKMPTKQHEQFDPITELENAVVAEEKTVSAKPDLAERTIEKPGKSADAWDNVDFESLSREEKAAYLKDQLKKKMGEG
ncbi:MAG: hypothetical protein V1909_04045 [Candidatus Micrarchaeota archaeon]